MPPKKQKTEGQPTGEKEAVHIVENMPVSVTGVQPGDILVAFRLKFYIGMIIEVLEGDFYPIAQRYDEVANHDDPELLGQLLQRLQYTVPRFRDMTIDEIRDWMQQNKSVELNRDGKDVAERDMMRKLGHGLRVRVLDPGSRPERDDYLRMVPAEMFDRAMSADGISAKELHDAVADAADVTSVLMFNSDMWQHKPPLETSNTVAPETLTVDLIDGSARLTDDQPLQLPEGRVALNMTLILPDPNNTRRGATVREQLAMVIEEQRPPVRLKADALAAVFAALPEEYRPASVELLEQAYDEFEALRLVGFTAGAYKSLLQKLIRYGAKRVNFPLVRDDTDGPSIPAELALAYTFIALYSHKGSFNPDTQTFVRGSEALLKRLMIISVEDSYVEESETPTSLRLAAASLLIRYYGMEWHPSRALLTAAARHAFVLLRRRSFTLMDTSESAASASKPYRLSEPKKLVQSAASNRPAAIRARVISALLDEVRSLAGDLRMFRNLAYRIERNEATRGENNNATPPENMPIWHCFDQHWYTQIIYLFDPEYVIARKDRRTPSFQPFFVQLFEQNTGLNWRRGSIEPASTEEVRFRQAVQEAQALCYAARRPDVAELPLAATVELLPGNYELEHEFEDAWLAGMVGHIGVFPRKNVDRRNFIATLDPENIDSFNVIVDPAKTGIGRTQRSALGSVVADTAKQEARDKVEDVVEKTVDKVNEKYRIEPELMEKLQGYAKDKMGGYQRANAVRVPSKSLRNAKARIEKDTYEIKLPSGEKKVWSKARLTRETIGVEFQRPAPLSFEQEHIAAFVYTVYPEDACAEIRAISLRLIESVPRAVLIRVLMYIGTFKEENSTVAMPKVGRDGGGSDEPLHPDDFRAYHFLVRLSLMYPKALRRKPGDIASFTVASPTFLWQLQEGIRMYMDSTRETGLQARWIGAINLEDYAAFPHRNLLTHQNSALVRMMSRKAAGFKGNFLWIPTGQGKTAIGLQHLKRLIGENLLPKYVLYVLPPSAFKSILREIDRFGFKTAVLWPNASTPAAERHLYENERGATKRARTTERILPYTINIIEQDHVRLVVDDLLQVASETYLIYDEVHRAMNKTTQRTAAAVSLVRASADFSLLSATPVTTSDMSLLIKYVEQLVPFPVNPRNVYVAANTMIRQVIDIGVKLCVEKVDAGIAASQLSEYLSLIPPGLGGTNRKPNNDTWARAAELAYAGVTTGILAAVQGLMLGGGVFVVAKDTAHREQLARLFANDPLLRKNTRIIEIGPGKQAINIESWDPAEHDDTVPVVIGPVTWAEGYNLQGLTSMVTSAYPTNPANLIQLDGRLMRIGQTGVPDEDGTPCVKKVVVLAGLLHNLYEKKERAHGLDEALKALAEEIKGGELQID